MNSVLHCTLTNRSDTLFNNCLSTHKGHARARTVKHCAPQRYRHTSTVHTSHARPTRHTRSVAHTSGGEVCTVLIVSFWLVFNVRCVAMGGPSHGVPPKSASPAPSAPVDSPIRRMSSKTPRAHVALTALGQDFAYLADNDFIRTGYRTDYTFVECLRRCGALCAWRGGGGRARPRARHNPLRPPCVVASMFHLHNETVNVWTHFIGALLFIGLIAHIVWQAYTTPAAQVVVLPGATCPFHEGPFLVGGAHTAATFAATVAPPNATSTIDWMHLPHNMLQQLDAYKHAFADGSCSAHVPCRCAVAPAPLSTVFASHRRALPA